MIAKRARELHLQQTLMDLLSPPVDEKKIHHLMETLCKNATHILRKLGDPIELMKNSRDDIFKVLVDNYLPAKKLNKKSEIYEDLLKLIDTYPIPPEDAKKMANSAADRIISHLVDDKENSGWLDTAKDLLPYLKNVSATDFLKLQNGIHRTTEMHRKALHDEFIAIYDKVIDAFLPLANFQKGKMTKEHRPPDEETIKKISLIETLCLKYLKANLNNISEAWGESRKSNLRFLEDACHTKDPESILSMLESFEYNEEIKGNYITNRLNTLISDWVKDKPEEDMAKIDFDAVSAKVLASDFNPLPFNISDGLSWRAYDLLKKELEAQKKNTLAPSSPTFLGQRQPYKKKESDVAKDHAKPISMSHPL